MDEVCFLHCADLHLGARPLGLEARFDDFGNAFERIVDHALESEVRFVLISGDFFHQRSINAATLGQALHALDRLRERSVPVYAIEGNHDAALYVDGESWMGFLNRQGYLRLLRPDADAAGSYLSEYDGASGCIAYAHGVRIVGLGYYFSASAKRMEQLAGQLPEYAGRTVLMLHSGVDRLLWQDANALSSSALSAFAGKVDYFALGHIHTRYEIPGGFYNPGAPEWVHIDEMKRANAEKGFYFVRISDGGAAAEFIPSTPRPVLFIDIQAQGNAGQSALEELAVENVKEAMDAHGLAPVVQIGIGTQEDTLLFDTQAVARAVESRCGAIKAEVWIKSGENEARESGEGEDGVPIERMALEELIAEELPGADMEEACGFVLGLRDALDAGTDPSVITGSLEEMVNKVWGEQINVG
ncbi:MAG: metallophosphoesterase family protein [Bacillota bacterium]